MIFLHNHYNLPFPLCETDEQLFKRLKRFGISETECEVAKLQYTNRGVTVIFERHETLIRLPKKPKTNEEWGVLQHEIFHATHLIMNTVGIELKHLVSDEAFAYVIGYLTEKIYDKL